jgi:hypothetical protein
MFDPKTDMNDSFYNYTLMRTNPELGSSVLVYNGNEGQDFRRGSLSAGGGNGAIRPYRADSDFVWSSAGFAALAEKVNIRDRPSVLPIVTGDYAKDGSVLPPTGESVAKSIIKIFASASMSQTDFVYICVDPDFENGTDYEIHSSDGQHSTRIGGWKLGTAIFKKSLYYPGSPHTWIIDMVTRLVDAFAHPRIEDNRHVENHDIYRSDGNEIVIDLADALNDLESAEQARYDDAQGHILAGEDPAASLIQAFRSQSHVPTVRLYAFNRNDPNTDIANLVNRVGPRDIVVYNGDVIHDGIGSTEMRGVKNTTSVVRKYRSDVGLILDGLAWIECAQSVPKGRPIVLPIVTTDGRGGIAPRLEIVASIAKIFAFAHVIQADNIYIQANPEIRLMDGEPYWNLAMKLDLQKAYERENNNEVFTEIIDGFSNKIDTELYYFNKYATSSAIMRDADELNINISEVGGGSGIFRGGVPTTYMIPGLIVTTLMATMMSVIR